MRALQVGCTKHSLLTVRRDKRWKKRMVYILTANKSFKYKSGRRSYIIYIGTTGKGSGRPATSAAKKASDAFKGLRGVNKIETHIATCQGRKRLRTWEHLEAALLATFRDLHFELPKYNKKKGAIRFGDDIRVFRLRALKRIIIQFED